MGPIFLPKRSIEIVTPGATRPTFRLSVFGPRVVARTFLGEPFLVFRIEFRQLADQPRPLLTLTQKTDGRLERTASVRVLSFPHPVIEVGHRPPI